MIKFEENTTNEAFAQITKAGAYNGRLIMLRKSLQDEKFAKDNKDGKPKELVSFVFDVINSEGQHVHVATRPCTFSFTDKSKLPELWANVYAFSNRKEFYSMLYDKDGNLMDFFGLLQISVEAKDDGKIYNSVKSIIQESDKTDIGTSELSDYDLRVYGTPCLEYDLAKGYLDQAPKNN